MRKFTPIAAASLLAMLILTLPIFGEASNSAAAKPITVGPKQQAALDECRATFSDQIRNCKPGSSYPECSTMYNDILSNCLANAETITEINGGGSSNPPKTKPPKINPPPKASQ